MNKFILIFALLLTKLFAYETLDISNLSSVKNIKAYQYCISDDKNSFTFEDILNNKDLEQIKKSNLGYKYNPYWCKIQVTNVSNETKEVVFYNQRPGIDYIDVNIYKNSEILKYNLGDMLTPKDRTFTSVFSNFTLKILPNEQVTIITKLNTIGNLELAWDIVDVKTFIKNENINNAFIYTFFGFVFAMMVYKLLIYYRIKDKEYLIYSAMMLSILISHCAIQGIFYQYFYDLLDMFTITLSSWIFTHLFLVFLWLFTYYFFAIDKKSKFYYPIIFVIIFNFIVLILYLSAYIWIDILRITPYIINVAFFEYIFLFIFSIVMFFKKKAGAGYFLLGHLFYILFLLNFLLILSAHLENTIITRNSSSIGIILLIMFMSLALSKKFKVMKEENARIQEQYEKNKQFMMIGTTISYVAHQWKQPISILGSQITSILAKIDNEPNLKASELQNKIYKLEDSTAYINNTLSHIKSIYTIKDIKKEFDLNKLIYEITEELKEQLNKNSIEVKINSKAKDLLLNGNRNLLSHALSNIIQNSIEAFEETLMNKTIEIDIEKSKKGFIQILIKDNAGGIKLEHIENVFNPEVTTKTFGTGIGLAFTKNIIESKFQGIIEVKNISNGTQFDINIKITK
jgi:two-component system, sensor histidine kinase LadS